MSYRYRCWIETYPPTMRHAFPRYLLIVETGWCIGKADVRGTFKKRLATVMWEIKKHDLNLQEGPCPLPRVTDEDYRDYNAARYQRDVYARAITFH